MWQRLATPLGRMILSQWKVGLTILSRALSLRFTIASLIHLDGVARMNIRLLALAIQGRKVNGHELAIRYLFQWKPLLIGMAVSQRLKMPSQFMMNRSEERRVGKECRS